MSGTQVLPVTNFSSSNNSLFSYRGTVDALLAANLPNITKIGDYYKISVSGTFQNSVLIDPLNSIFSIGDAIVWNGSLWDKIDNTDSLIPPSSETISGIIELATAAETTTGTDNIRAIHPAGLNSKLSRVQSDKTQAVSPYTVILSDANSALTNKGSTAAVIFNLPVFSSTVIGKKFIFIRIVDQPFTVNVAAGDRIATGVTISNTAVGQTFANITLSAWNDVAASTLLWIIEAAHGTWVTA